MVEIKKEYFNGINVNLGRNERLFKEAITIITESIQKKDDIRLKAMKILEDKNKIKKHNKELNAISFIKNYHDKIPNKKQFLLALKVKIQEIEVLDPKLAQYIKDIKIDDRELRFLANLYKAINLPGENLVVYLDNNFNQIKKQLEIYNDKKTFNKLRRVLYILNNQEIKYLTAYLTDVRNWSLYRKTNSIDFFINKLNLYLRGNKSKNREKYLGIADHFRDGALYKRLLSTTETRRLLLYNEERILFDSSRQLVHSALRNPQWIGEIRKPDGKIIKMPFGGKGGFYYNLRNGEKYIERVRVRYGNRDFADFLESLTDNIGQQPLKWDEDLLKLEKKLNDYNYENNYVIGPATMSLISIFSKRIIELQEERKKAGDDLKEILEKRINEVGNIADSASRKLMLRLRLKEIRVRSRWNSRKRKIGKRSRDIVDLVSFLLYEIKDLFNFLDVDTPMANMGRLNYHKIKWMKYSRVLMKNVKQLTINDKLKGDVHGNLTRISGSISSAEDSNEKIQEIKERMISNLSNDIINKRILSIFELFKKIDSKQNGLIFYLKKIGLQIPELNIRTIDIDEIERHINSISENKISRVE
jgi:hypothetical protein|tara:strand:+ start:1216 stop:2979 length:1764 start_codon:yes stop_codon:yes gene_type:complete